VRMLLALLCVFYLQRDGAARKVRLLQRFFAIVKAIVKKDWSAGLNGLAAKTSRRAVSRGLGRRVSSGRRSPRTWFHL
jgi:hypothetical protein